MQRVHTIPLRGHPRLRPTRWTPQSFAHSSLTLAQRPTAVAPQNPKPIPTPIPSTPVANTNSSSHTNANPHPNPNQLLDDYWKNQQGLSTATSANQQAYPPHPLDPQDIPAWATFSDTDDGFPPKAGDREPWWKQGETYTEDNRQNRRTVFMHDDWVRHRSSNRFLRNMRSLPSSGINQALSKELTFVTLVALFVVVVNALGSGYQDFSGVMHPGAGFAPLMLPALPFTILMPALSLLLVFRTNTGYFRWNEARTLWGGLINTCRNVVRQSNTFFPDDAMHNGLKVRIRGM